MERYPVFVSVVLNHVSEATSVFWNALRCLQLLLEILGEQYLFFHYVSFFLACLSWTLSFLGGGGGGGKEFWVVCR